MYVLDANDAQALDVPLVENSAIVITAEVSPSKRSSDFHDLLEVDLMIIF
jgi:hypothetical protein